ncbi:unnamed protein product [Miscanthus lutarioriparius]|uniref:Aromatic amino acid beta-eliminating lyase/threonine aldolase domain-containing protein n=1 Tax=Miscanthus lutarioriparius TaxID=422564 RepID=A0A811QVP7_9POAL|nr:unnamed protein product [Miscanthus lutarioriparius]
MATNKVVDLRSDTVTKPSEAMRATMARRPWLRGRDGVDDDVQRPGRYAYLQYELSMHGIKNNMGNLVSVLAHCDVRGSEVILVDDSHIHLYENGGVSTIGGVHPETVRNNADGTMDIDRIVSTIRPPGGGLYYPTTRLICLENTHGNSGGKCLSVEYTDKVGEIAKSHGLKLHIDGARIFNASVALGVPVDRLVKAADSVLVCMSKGLGAPVGSVIVGSKAFIDKAKILRKTGMRKVGVLCAAAHVAVRDTLGKLADDHRKAPVRLFLSQGLNKIEQFTVDSASVESNMVFLDIVDSRISCDKLCQVLGTHNVLSNPRSPKSVRLGLHYQISDTDVQYALTCFNKAVEELLKGSTEFEHLADTTTKNSYGH